MFTFSSEIFLGGASLVFQWYKNPPTNAGNAVWFLGQEDPMEKEMVTHSSILALESPWTEETGRLQSTES